VPHPEHRVYAEDTAIATTARARVVTGERTLTLRFATAQADVIRLIQLEPVAPQSRSTFRRVPMGTKSILSICHCIARRARHGILQHNLGVSYHRSRGIGHRSRQSCKNSLSSQRDPAGEKNRQHKTTNEEIMRFSTIPPLFRITKSWTDKLDWWYLNTRCPIPVNEKLYR